MAEAFLDNFRHTRELRELLCRRSGRPCANFQLVHCDVVRRRVIQIPVRKLDDAHSHLYPIHELLTRRLTVLMPDCTNQDISEGHDKP